MKDWQHWKTPLMSNSTNGNDVPGSAIAYRAGAEYKIQPLVVNPDMMCTCGFRARVHAKSGNGACTIAGIHCAKFELVQETTDA